MSFPPKFSVLARFGALGLAGAALAGCNASPSASNARAWKPIPSETVSLMNAKGTDAHKPILIRAYKKEAELEIWKMKADGRYTLLKTYPMCRWSGQLGPKVREGDRQVPEGFYAITPGQMNPNSNWYLSFNVGYPNTLDRALGHTGGSIMVHGACSSAGCFSMTDNQIAEIYAVAREAFGGGQREIQMESFPFRMTAENLAKHRLDPNMPFWRQLKEGSDHFEVTKREPTVGVCGRHYVFDEQPANGGRLDPSGPCPALAEDPEIRQAVAAKASADNSKVAELVARGVKPIRIQYADGGQNPQFAAIDEVSRPEALEAGPVEIPLDEKGRPIKASPAKIARGGAKIPTTVAETVAARAPEPATPPTALAAAGSKTGDAIGRLLAFGQKTDPAPAPVATVPETILVTDPDKPQKAGRKSAAAKPQALLDMTATGRTN
ncbi:MAG: murein L,D-transpeptidase [Hyphomicrobiales bacterium]|nr:murein L,D-transpeptidase [Hyphomicrobiales bacterium]